ncbi:MAG: indolepyruvate oxidoreductase subunit beta [Treponema sp.]|nr:indolepyruvate oxidoreductase subunit beta [Treponema sp.]
MKCDVILAGVGGQGVLSIAAIIARAAVKEGFLMRQSEVHGMAQRGGAVLAHLRIAGGPIASDLTPRGGADLIISMEPMESLRYAAWLAPEGTLITAAERFINIPGYPSLPLILESIQKFPRRRIIEAAGLAREAGFARAVNMVMVGAASPFLPIPAETLEEAIAEMFASKFSDSGGVRDSAGIRGSVADANRRAFKMGREAAK